ncbi:hypothetical protein PQ077_01345 [Litorivicinus sp.]|nr:hypothetical protein [Litorivicinus sp.]
MKLILSWILLVFLSTSVWAESSDEKLLKLLAANDALTERVAELLQENRRLQKAVQDALNAQKTGSKIVTGCDTKQFHKTIAFESNSILQEAASMDWLKENGAECTQSQLSTLVPIVKSMSFSSASLNLIKFYQAAQ